MAVPVGDGDDLLDVVGFGPPGADFLDAGGVAVEQDHVGVPVASAVELAPDGVGVGDGLAAGEGDEGAVWGVGGDITLLEVAEVRLLRRARPGS